ncbi:MAG: hypothetical protein ACRDQW_02190 [Haloechinothrix sp.]
MLLGAGLLTGMAVGAAAGGWWLLGGIVLAASLAASSVLTRPTEWPVLRAATLVALAAMLALSFAAYLVPEYPVPAAASLIVVVTGAVVVGAEVPVYGRRLLVGVLLLAAAGFVAICVAIAPPGTGDAWFAYPSGDLVLYQIPPWPASLLPGPAGILSSAVVLFALFTVVDRRRPRRTLVLLIAAGAGVALTVAAAAFYQLGPFRLALSPTSLRDALAAADAAELTTMLDALVVLATVPAVLVVLAAGRDELLHGRRHWPRGACTVLAGASAALLVTVGSPGVALLLASTLALGALLMGWAHAAIRPRLAPGRAGSGPHHRTSD